MFTFLWCVLAIRQAISKALVAYYQKCTYDTSLYKTKLVSLLPVSKVCAKCRLQCREVINKRRLHKFMFPEFVARYSEAQAPRFLGIK